MHTHLQPLLQHGGKLWEARLLYRKAWRRRPGLKLRHSMPSLPGWRSRTRGVCPIACTCWEGRLWWWQLWEGWLWRGRACQRWLLRRQWGLLSA